MMEPADHNLRTNNEPSGRENFPAEIRAQRLMRRETRVKYGAAPHSILHHALPEMNWQIKADRFLLRGVGDHYFYYRVGAGIVVERGTGAVLEDEHLWLNGTVYSAVASLNGLLPLHASAVAWERRVIGFTGAAGAGKSTLVAALGDRGLPMFCDDTLVLDISDPERIICLPGHKRLKLTQAALALTSAGQEEKVSADIDKFFASPTSGDVGAPLPLDELVFLDEAPEPRIEAIRGSERFLRIQDEHYTAALFAHAQRLDRKSAFRHFARLASQIRMTSFARPKDTGCFDDGVALALEHIRGRA